MTEGDRKRRWRLWLFPLLRTLSPAISVIVVMLIGLGLSPYSRFVLSLAAIAAIIGTGLVMLVGQIRIVSLASAAFAGIGAYGTAVLMERVAAPYILAAIAAMLLCFGIGLLLGVPSLRFSGHYLTLVTLVFQISAIIGLRQWDSVTGGPRGLLFPNPGSLGLGLDTQLFVYLLSFLCCAIVVGIGSMLIHGDFGKALAAIADTAVASEAFAVRPDHYRILVFGVSAGLAGLGGALLGPLMRVIDPPAFDIFQSIIHVSMVVIGGMTSIWGGLVGGFALTILPESIRPLAEYQDVVFAGLLLFVVLTMPDGLVGRLGALVRGLSGRRGPTAFAGGSHASRPEESDQGDCKQEQSTDQKRYPKKIRAAVTAGTPGTANGGRLPVVLRCEGVSKSFAGLQAVRGADLAVRRGEIRALIGPNGAGKSTLLNLLSGVDSLDSGRVLLRGKVVSGHRPSTIALRGMTRTFQNVQLFSKLSALDNVRIGMLRFTPVQTIASSVSAAFRKDAGQEAEVRDVLEHLGFTDPLDAPAGTLSLGSQRRLEIARAVVSRPQVLLLDEPVAGLTSNERALLSELLRRLVDEYGVSMVLVEHTIEFVSEISSQMTAMVDGQVVAEGTPSYVLNKPILQQAYFGV